MLTSTQNAVSGLDLRHDLILKSLSELNQARQQHCYYIALVLAFLLVQKLERGIFHAAVASTYAGTRVGCQLFYGCNDTVDIKVQFEASRGISFLVEMNGSTGSIHWSFLYVKNPY